MIENPLSPCPGGINMRPLSLSPSMLLESPMAKRMGTGGKTVCVFRSHNQVLEAWEKSPGLNVFSLDFHTDTKGAFGNYSYWRTDSEVKAGRCKNPELRIKELVNEKITAYLEGRTTIQSLNDNLRHDEHIDFAVRTDMIGMAFILATNRNDSSSNPHVFMADSTEEYKGQRIIEYSPPCVPGCRKSVHDDECIRLRADCVIEDDFLADAVSKAESFDPSFFKNYILDMDCDYFNTEKSLKPRNLQVFRKLIREASLITIALEAECVKICRLDDGSMDSDRILDALTALIGEA